MDALKLEGVILKAFDFKERDKILTVFTPEGVIKYIVKGRSKKFGVIQPLTRAEFVYKESRGELQNCIELSTLNYYLPLRDSLAALESAFAMVETILKTQMPHAETDLIYHLFLSYLNKMHLMLDPATLATSFSLKVLLHEGLLGENFNQTQIIFSQEEQALLTVLTYGKTFSQMNELSLSLPFKQKVAEFFTLSLAG